jgi:hypothetical protein
MMTSKRRPLTTNLCPSSHLVDKALEPRLLLYALAGGAILASASSTQAEVIFTPSSAVLQGEAASLAIDLDHDGSTDFTIAIEKCRTYSGYGIGRCLEAHGQSPSDQVGMFGPTGGRTAEALAPGTQVTGGHRFRADAVMASLALGSWRDVSNRYLGVRFRIDGQFHYAWIGFRSVIVDQNGFTATFGGWAYETESGKTIVTGDRGTNSAVIQPTALEILAAGHTGKDERRKRTITAGGHE